MEHVEFRHIELPKDIRILKPNGYICKILSAKDYPRTKSLRVTYDIAEGYYQDYFQEKYDREKYWYGVFFVQYRDGARLKYFRAFIEAVEKSNNYTFNYDENELTGKKLGLVIGWQKHIKDNKEYRNLVPVYYKTVEEIRNNMFEVPNRERVYGAIKQYYTDEFENNFLKE